MGIGRSFYSVWLWETRVSLAPQGAYAGCMKKLAALVALALASVLFMAAPAFAQRDPFDPVIDPNAPPVVTGAEPTGTTTTTTTLPPNVGSDQLANTGADVAPWLAIAYGLVAMGAGAVVIARMYQPQLVRRR